jgi:hypothetical protein
MEVLQPNNNMRLKSWESPRSEGRNSKGKGGTARARQLKKRQQTLRKLLKAQKAQSGDGQNKKEKETYISFSFFYLSFLNKEDFSWTRC